MIPNPGLATKPLRRALVQIFNLRPEKPCDYLLSCCYRLSAKEDSRYSVRRSLTPSLSRTALPNRALSQQLPITNYSAGAVRSARVSKSAQSSGR